MKGYLHKRKYAYQEGYQVQFKYLVWNILEDSRSTRYYYNNSYYSEYTESSRIRNRIRSFLYKNNIPEFPKY